MEMMVLDVRRAHFYARALRRIFVEMPREDPRYEECQGVAELLMSLYGTQDAAANWEAEYSDKLQGWGYKKGEASPCVFYNPGTNIRILVHGDDFVAVGRRYKLDALQEQLESVYECKVQRIGWQRGRAREARILGRVITLTEEGANIEPDPALLEEVVHLLGMQGAAATVTPANKEDYFGDISGEEVKKRRLQADQNHHATINGSSPGVTIDLWPHRGCGHLVGGT